MSDVTHSQIPEIALAWIAEGKKAALATVIETWGSAPRPQGSQLVISSEAEIQGSVSGGCVESAVVAEALEALEDGQSRVLEYGISDDDAFAVGLACGGEIHVMVEPIGVGNGPELEMMKALVKARGTRVPVVLGVNTSTWERRFVEQGDALWQAATTALHSDKSAFEGDWFLGVHNPPLRMIIVGAVHIAQPLVTMARLTGYDPYLIDPREAFGADHRFPGEQISNDWADAAIRDYGIDARTALITLSHDPKIDDPALIAGLQSDAFYIGALGSKRTHAKRVERLEATGLGNQVHRIHAPIGADIGSKSPAEIAVSIMAELTERLRRPETRP